MDSETTGSLVGQLEICISIADDIAKSDDNAAIVRYADEISARLKGVTKLTNAVLVTNTRRVDFDDILNRVEGLREAINDPETLRGKRWIEVSHDDGETIKMLEESLWATQAEVKYVTEGYEEKIEQDRLHHVARVEELERLLAKARGGNGAS